MKRTRLVSKLMTLVMAVTLIIPAKAASRLEYQDVPETFWAYPAIMDMTERGLFKGTSVAENGVGTFSPDDPMTRAGLITVLTRYLYSNELGEMPENDEAWYANNYIIALRYGLLTSEELDHGDLDRPCSRQEMAMLLVRAAYVGVGEVATNLLPTAKIPDYLSIDEEYRSYVLQAYSLGLLVGVNSKGTFDPTGTLNRAQAATAIYRLIDPSTRKIISADDDISFTWNDGTTYTGPYRNGEATGLGKMEFPGIGSYVGYFVNGKREGLGTFTWLSGDKYVGNWNLDKMCGEGTYTFADGYTIKGVWEDNRIAIKSLYMEPSSLTMTVGTMKGIVARVMPEVVTEAISWSSSNDAVVAVDGRGNLGKLTAKRTGTATIVATSETGKTTMCNVTVVEPPVQRITLSYGDYDMFLGDSFVLSVLLFPENAADNIEWSSSNPSVASVDSSGKVIAEGLGTAVISAETENGLIATCYVYVMF